MSITNSFKFFIFGFISFFCFSMGLYLTHIRSIDRLPMEIIIHYQHEKPIFDELNIPETTVFKPLEIVIHYNPNQFEIAETLDVDQAELDCLTLNLYREARNQGHSGLVAVGSVTRNRVEDVNRFPNTYCEVIHQYKQFSWTLKEELRRKPNLKSPYEKKYWLISQQVAKAIITGEQDSNVGQATHYHATYVNPKWSKKLTRFKQIKDHIFYL